jgi:5-dehydro-4-deoxyglucarate dehydratase
MQFTPQDLKHVMSSGLLSFPVADFNTDGSFNACGWDTMPALCVRHCVT